MLLELSHCYLQRPSAAELVFHLSSQLACLLLVLPPIVHPSTTSEHPGSRFHLYCPHTVHVRGWRILEGCPTPSCTSLNPSRTAHICLQGWLPWLAASYTGCCCCHWPTPLSQPFSAHCPISMQLAVVLRTAQGSFTRLLHCWCCMLRPSMQQPHAGAYCRGANAVLVALDKRCVPGARAIPVTGA